jgi:hypothetical protein
MPSDMADALRGISHSLTQFYALQLLTWQHCSEHVQHLFCGAVAALEVTHANEPRTATQHIICCIKRTRTLLFCCLLTAIC